ncbi:MAG TPA: PadR family transcriptional regulator [Methanobacterium sp.]|jgi:PadR family transcriptional regulator PadR|nr:PadR family transcriptional regulator [Methanobacterium sp.]HOI39742.1 PadR family transcriptional regulator [Methanobacterium sp.]
MNAQFKKGVLKLLVLVLLDKKDCYGYEMVDEISKSISISEGTIYPLLKRLKKEKMVSSYLKESQDGPPRKYYKITDSGKEKKAELVAEWFEFSNGVNNLVHDKMTDDNLGDIKDEEG